MDLEAGVRLLFIPFEAGEVGLFKLIVLLMSLLVVPIKSKGSSIRPKDVYFGEEGKRQYLLSS